MPTGLTLLTLIALPFIAALAIALLHHASRAVHSAIAGAASAGGLALLAGLAPAVIAGSVPSAQWAWVPALGLDLTLMVDPLGLMFAGLILGIGLLVIIFAHFYLYKGEATGRFFASLMLFQGAMLGIVIAGNVLLLLVFWEMTSLASFLLIGFWQHKAEARQGARMALAVTGGGGLALIGGMVLLGMVAGSFDLATILTRGDVVRGSPLYPAILGLALIGCFTKSAQFPFHFWLPHAMAAPTPVSAYLHSATMVKAGVFLLARLWPVLAGTEVYTLIVTSVGLITMIFGAGVALFRHDLKSILAYSTISQLGMLVMLLGFSLEAAALAAVLHILNHAAFKAALFMSAGIVEHETGTRDIRRLGGLAKAMPVTALIATLAAASMAGLPPLGGFISKEAMLYETPKLVLFGLPWLLPALATLGATLSVAYSLRLAAHLFFGKPREAEPFARAHDPGAGMWVAPAVLTALAVLLGLIPMTLAAPLVGAVTGAVTGAPVPEFDLALWHGINLALILSLAAVAGGVLLLWQHKPLLAAWERARLPDAKRMFESAFAFADAWVRKAIVATHTPSLQTMLLASFTVIVLLVVEGALTGGGMLTGSRPGLPAPAPAIVAWALLIAATVAVVNDSRNRLRVLIYISVIGLVVSLTFVVFSAPDLALTQISVEVVTILLLLLALNLLPKRPPLLSSAPLKWRDGALAITGGLLIGGIAWAMLTRDPGPSIAAYHLANAKPGGGGTNVVNVILVDFRAFDTLGEIIVLGIAGLGIFALLDTAATGKAGERLRAWRADMPHSPERHPMMLVAASRIILPLTLSVGIYLFLRGHNQPGGGFIAALVVAIAFLVQYLAAGFDWSDARRRFGEHQMIAAGVLVAMVTGLGATVFGANFLTSWFDYFSLPLIGKFELASAMAFDAGVFLTVFGAVMLALAQLSHIAQRAGRAAEADGGGA
ncbi:monovalent cation/H+ antiporter subunit A [Porphyrobacter sp. ULC335]|uniref:monovalent cation/H+ antiporter subunit A n=1 Tax=Porphyrobacter sp. ULC335 TaxID=2854260 RepID=UPI00221E7566|nr:monovalent cation/H+ antiporter subunit A [Porphyrobacter sp. ULC335]UYV16039.1 monovalent cation/H+ antiporter subunit A [Porphyrobacter sp. ULC335]